ncbi:MAG: GNAT family N-acetyltransferase [Acidiferrobacterales bacterium]|nr:GNAT family N-acetyltransferase [Acidiferrobacterales bacterium]
MSVEITYYLEMKSARDLVAQPQPKDFVIRKPKIVQFQINRFLYQFIGEPWNWTGKLSHTDQQWRDYVERDCLSTWIAYLDDSIVGYYELEQQNSGDVEIVYLGLSSKAIGKGLGAYLLTHAVESAWNMESTTRVWLHTCTHDHDNALKNYLSRGFTLYRQTET